MEALVLVALLVVALCFIIPIVAIAKASRALEAIELLTKRVGQLEGRLRAGETPAVTGVAVAPSVERAAAPAASRPQSVPPPLPTVIPTPAPAAPTPAAAKAWDSKMFATSPPPSMASPKAPPATPVIDWEQFMGAKLFAWIGGLALFLGVAFFVKYSFEHNLISPAARVAIGFLVGLGLLGGGISLKRKENAVTSQTLCATGILILYAVTFACRSYYHFAFFGLVPTFLLMALITATAFVVAVRLDAMLVAVLGMAGGFLTPVLLSTHQDNPLGLFGYITLLDIGLLTVALRKQWQALPILGAIGTGLIQVGWVGQFFASEKYFSGNHTLVPMIVFLAFELLFVAACFGQRRAGEELATALFGSAVGMGGAALSWAFYFLAFATIAHRPALLFAYLFLADLSLLALIWPRPKDRLWLSGVVGIVVYGLLAGWTVAWLRPSFLYVALAGYLIFAVLHVSLPLVLQRRSGAPAPAWTHLFPAITLVIILIPVLQLSVISFVIWPALLLVDLLAIFLAVATGLLIPVMLVLFLTFVILASWSWRIPLSLDGLTSSLSLIGIFAIFFLVASAWAARRVMMRTAGSSPGTGSLFGDATAPANAMIQIPALSATLPFLLLIMVTLRLPLENPSPVFGLGLVLVVLLLGMTRLLSLNVLAAVALASTLALEHAWHINHFEPNHATGPILWYLGFTAIFTIFPFAFARGFKATTTVWAVSALAAPLHFFLVYDAVRRVYPNATLGLLPAAFALPSLLELYLVAKRSGTAGPERTSQLAFFGGAALFFITLIFPIQFDREWITIGWALEGAALCWLFQRVPHPGLRLTGVALLAIAFARLAFNPAVLEYHTRTSTPVFNWYLYAYGLTTFSFFAAAHFLRAPRRVVLGHNVLPLLYSLGTVLAFLLLNIEIADYFTPAGRTTLTFQFEGNFARDMSYSIGWAIFALALLIVGIRRNAKPVRYAAIVLLLVTLVKLFAHDMAQLPSLYRIVAVIVVSVVAIFASFLYQRFFNSPSRQTPQGAS